MILKFKNEDEYDIYLKKYINDDASLKNIIENTKRKGDEFLLK